MFPNAKDSMENILLVTFPEHPWDTLRFKKPSISPSELTRSKLERFKYEFKIQDWRVISTDQIKELLENFQFAENKKIVSCKFMIFKS